MKTDQERPSKSPFPSVDRLARQADIERLMTSHGRSATIDAIRTVLDAARRQRAAAADNAAATAPADEAALSAAVVALVTARATPSLRRMFNLTGTVLHTNLGRALLSDAAVRHVTMAMTAACNLEYDIDSGGRGERDSLVEGLLCDLTGAAAATVVNNNAAAVLLLLAAVAARREVIVSRGELVEIGGAFRVPDVMRNANVKLVEIGTTNRTHARDYEQAIGPRSAALMKVHASNYTISGFVAEVAGSEVAAIAHRHDLPYLVDLGAGSLIDLASFGLPREPVVRDVLADGADVVTFSGDKLLGGPQAGLIVGRKDLIDKIKRHPLKRALRVNKMTLAALEATLLAYRHPERLTQDLPTLRLLTRAPAELQVMAPRLQAALAAALGTRWTVDIVDVKSQVGSGSMPIETLPSVALAIKPPAARAGAVLKQLAERLRALPIPVIGRISDNMLLLDLRCLEDEAAFTAQLPLLQAS